MLKKFSVFSVVLSLVTSISAQAKNEILVKWDASNKFQRGISLYCSQSFKATKKFSTLSSSPDNGCLKVKIISSKEKSPTDIQLTFCFGQKIMKGAKYRIEISLEADKAGFVIVTAIMNNRPWRILAKNACIKENLEAKKMKVVAFEFTAEKNFTDVRVPCLFLGKLKTGTQLSIKSVLFERIF